MEPGGTSTDASALTSVATDASSLVNDASSLVNDESMSTFLPFIQSALSQHSQGITFATVTLIAMQAVEQYSAEIKGLAGPDKLAAAKILVPEILQLAVLNRAITQDQADDLKAKFAVGATIMEELIEAYIVISKNPEVVQAVEAAKMAAKGCIAKCKGKEESTQRGLRRKMRV